MTVKGSARPLTLYTLDIAEDDETVRAGEKLDPTGGSLPEDEATALELFNVQRAHAELAPADASDPALLDAEREALEELEREVRTFRRTAAMYALRRTTTFEFLQIWERALGLYFAGSWLEAHALFGRCKQILPDDGPTTTLMEYLARRDLKAPPAWSGARMRAARAPGARRELWRAGFVAGGRAFCAALTPCAPGPSLNLNTPRAPTLH